MFGYLGPATVQSIAQNRTSDMSQVDSNLVSLLRKQIRLQEGALDLKLRVIVFNRTIATLSLTVASQSICRLTVPIWGRAGFHIIIVIMIIINITTRRVFLVEIKLKSLQFDFKFLI